MLSEGFVREDTCGTYLDEITAEFVFQRPVLKTAKINVLVYSEHPEIAPARVVCVEPQTSVAVDAPVHLMFNEGAEVLISVRAFLKPVFSIVVACHHGHVLQVAFTTFITDRAVVRMVDHQPFNYAGAELSGLGIVNRNSSPICGRRLAGGD
jgi:hypothetical protein